MTAIPPFDYIDTSDGELHRIITDPYTAFDTTHRALAAELLTARADLDRVREALAGHPYPHCGVHPTTDSVSCGWKRVVGDVQRALDHKEVGA